MSTPRIQPDTGTAPTNYPQARHPLPKPQITISTPISEASNITINLRLALSSLTPLEVSGTSHISSFHPQICQLRRLITQQTSFLNQATPRSTPARICITTTPACQARNTNCKQAPSLATRNATTTVQRLNVLQQKPRSLPRRLAVKNSTIKYFRTPKGAPTILPATAKTHASRSTTARFPRLKSDLKTKWPKPVNSTSKPS